MPRFLPCEVLGLEDGFGMGLVWTCMTAMVIDAKQMHCEVSCCAHPRQLLRTMFGGKLSRVNDPPKHDGE